MATIENATEIRPFHLDVLEEELADLRGRIAATRWPEGETVPDASQGVQLATMEALARYWATEYDFRRLEARLNALPQFMTEIDGVDIQLHPRPVAARGRAASDHDPRLAGLCHRAARDRRPAHRPDRARRRRRGRVPPGPAVAARLRLFGRAERTWLGRGPHRGRLGGADAPHRLHPLRGPGRRRWGCRHRLDEPAGARRAAR